VFLGGAWGGVVCEVGGGEVVVQSLLEVGEEQVQSKAL
jgi:hypothetical protein